MRYEELQSLCVEIHSGKCDQSRNYEIQRYLNHWSNNVQLPELFQIMAQCESNRDWIYTFVYVLSVLERYLLKNLPYLTLKELREAKVPLYKLMSSGKLHGFNLLKLSKLISIMLFYEMSAYDEAFGEIVVNLDGIKKLNFMNIFLEEFTTNSYISEEQRQHIFKCLYSSSAQILGPLSTALGSPSPDNMDFNICALKLLGQVINIFSLDLDEMASCIGHALVIATNVNKTTLKLSTHAIESLTEVLAVTHISRRRNTLVYLTTGQHCDYRRNEKYRKVFSLMISEIFGLVARLSETTQSLNLSFFSWNFDSEFMPKVIHFCRTFMANHFSDFASMKAYGVSDLPQFSTIELLELFFKLTFNHTSTEAIEGCLEIWDDFLDQLQVIYESKSSAPTEYMGLLVSLFNESLKMTQFVTNQDLLNDLDGEELDADGETERGHFLSSNIEIIAKICVLHPIDILNALVPNLKSTINQQMANQLNENQTRDLGTLLQITGRLVEHFLGENFLKFHDESQSILRLLLGLSNQLAGSIESFGDAELELFAQCLSCLRPFQHWLSQYYSHCQTEALSQQTIVDLSNQTTSLSLTVLKLPNHEKIENLKKIAAQLVQCWSGIVRPAFIDKVTAIEELIGSTMNGTSKNLYDDETLKLLLLTSASLFLLPYPNTPVKEQNWQQRMSHFKQLCNIHQDNYEFLTGCCALVYSESSGCRDACAFGLRDIILKSITENIEDMEAINLVHKYFTCLRQQATNDAELCSTTVKACSVGFTPEMTAELSSSDKGLKFMESSISILSAVIEYSKDKELLQMIIQFVMNTLLKVANQNPVLHASILSFLTNLISAKWRTFFPGNVLSSIFDRNQNQQMQYLEVLLKIIETFIEAITSVDLTLSRAGIQHLLDLHKERKFFDNKNVKVNFNHSIGAAIFNVLIEGHHYVLHDELFQLLYLTIYNNTHVYPPNNLKISQKIFSNEYTAKLPTNFMDKFDIKIDFPSFRLFLQNLLLELRNR